MGEVEARIEQCRLELERAVIAAGFVVTGDGRVSECVAAKLVGVSARHLRRLRVLGEIEGYRVGQRITYRLSALAEWIESTRDDFAQ